MSCLLRAKAFRVAVCRSELVYYLICTNENLAFFKGADGKDKIEQAINIVTLNFQYLLHVRIIIVGTWGEYRGSINNGMTISAYTYLCFLTCVRK